MGPLKEEGRLAEEEVAWYPAHYFHFRVANLLQVFASPSLAVGRGIVECSSDL